MTSTLLRDTKRVLRSVVPAPILNWRETQFYARYGEVELHLMPYLCRPDRDTIDIGANDGCYVHFARKYSRQVIAFEPLPWLATGLAKRFGQSIEIHEVALSRTAGRTILRIPVVDDIPITGCATISLAASQQYPACREIEIATDTLDRLYRGEAGFIKIDVEGHEEGVLDGARETIARCQPRLLVEIDERLAPGAVDRIGSLFRSLGYRGYFIFQGSLLTIDRFDKNVMQRRANLPDLKAGLEARERFGRYIYNFLFLPPDYPDNLLRKMVAAIGAL